MEMRQFAPEMFALHGAGEYEAARKLVIDALPQLAAEDLETVTFWRICLDARTGRHESALDELERALEKGWWYGAEMLADTDLDGIREEARFQAVAAHSAAAEAAARRKPSLPIVTEPVGERCGTVAALHAAAGRSTHTSRIWAPALGLGYRTIAVTSSQRVTSDRGTWTDLDQAISDVTSQIEDPTGRLILGGRSMGAAVALHLATTGTIPASGLIMVAPSIRWDLVAPGAALPTVVLAGANDSERLQIRARDAAEFLGRSGSPVNFRLVPGMGHFYPDDFDRVLIEAIGWIESQLPQ